MRFCISVFCRIAVLILSVCAGQSAYPADISTGAGNGILRLSGLIVKGDDRKFADLLRQTQAAGHAPQIWLESDGGDVEVALKIGRLVRQNDMATYAQRNCKSSCVFILAGGVVRDYFPLNARQGDGVGIHRFYFADLSPSLSSREVAGAYSKLKKMIADYFMEMNIPQELLTAMETVEPGKMRLLSTKELEDFRLVGQDPVYDERETARLAARYGTTSAEFRRREARTEVVCGQLPIPVPTNDEWTACTEAIRYGLSKSEYRRKTKILDEALKSRRGNVTWMACQKAIFFENKNTCD